MIQAAENTHGRSFGEPQEYIKGRKQQEILSLFGTIDYEPGYDYKRERKAKRA
jgi:hypothetical protein